MSKLPEIFAVEPKKPKVPWEKLTNRQKLVRTIRGAAWFSGKPGSFWGLLYHKMPWLDWPDDYFVRSLGGDIVNHTRTVKGYEFEVPMTRCKCGVGEYFKSKGIDHPLDQIDDAGVMGGALKIALAIADEYYIASGVK